MFVPQICRARNRDPLEMGYTATVDVGSGPCHSGSSQWEIGGRVVRDRYRIATDIIRRCRADRRPSFTFRRVHIRRGGGEMGQTANGDTLLSRGGIPRNVADPPRDYGDTMGERHGRIVGYG